MSVNSAEITRRSLIASGLAAAFVPVHAEAPSRTKRTSANDRVGIALIGCGGMGNVDVRWALDEPETEMVALCDVDETHLRSTIQGVTDYARSKGKTGAAPKGYKDFRHVLERKDVDAVIITTPDHWHALPLILACEAGKDAYCEKPISHDITEARSMEGAVKHFQRIVQIGTWQRSTPEFVSAVAYIRSGKLGRITTVNAWKTDEAQMGRHVSYGNAPSTFDYDFWTGPAVLKPYIPQYTHGNWRWFFDYGSGMTGDWGVHMMDIGMLGMSPDTNLTMPYAVSAMGGKLAYPNDDRTAPDTVWALMSFKNPNFVMTWRTDRNHAGLPDHGTQFVSADGRSLTVWRGGWKIQDSDGTELPKEESPPTNSHFRNWLDCLKSREQPRANLSSVARTTMVCHLINASYLTGETLKWDSNKLDIIGHTGKETRSYERTYRHPWRLPIYRI